MSIRPLKEVGNFFRALFRRNSIAGELNTEIEQHIDLMAADFAAQGMSPKEARKAALQKFGNVERYKEESRDSLGTRIFLDLFRSIQFGLILLRKHFGTSVMAIMVLAFGTGIALTLFSFVNTLIWPDLELPDSDRLVYMEWRDVEGSRKGVEAINIRDFEAFKKETDGLVSMSAYQLFNPTLVVDRSDSFAERYLAARVSQDFFGILDVSPLLGRVFNREDSVELGKKLTVLSHSVWQDQYNRNPNVVGEQLRLNEEIHTIIGVMPEGFAFPSAEKLWVLSDWSDSISLPREETPKINAFGKLKKGVSKNEVKIAMDTTAKRLAETYPISNENLQSVGVDPYAWQTNSTNMWIVFQIMMLMALLVLVVACMNIFNIMLGRSAKRSFELTVRNSLGATKLNIVGQVVMDGFIICLLGAMIGLALAHFAISYINSAILSVTIQDLPYWLKISIDRNVLLFVVCTIILTTILSSVLPAIRVARATNFEMLKDSMRTSSGIYMGRLSRMLVASQIAVSTFVLLASILNRDLLRGIASVELPFDGDRVLLAKVNLDDRFSSDEEKVAFLSNLKQEMESQPGLQSIVYSSVKDGMFENRIPFEIEGVDYTEGEMRPRAGPNILSPNAFELLGLNLLSGKMISDLDTKYTEKVCLLGQSMVRQWFPTENPIGQRIKFRGGPLKGEWIKIVGVVSKQNLQANLQLENAKGGVYLPLAQWSIGTVSILANGGSDPFVWIDPIRKGIRKFAPGLAVPSVFVTVQEFLDQERSLFYIFVKLFTSFGLLALVIASVGLYCVISFYARERWKEYGIRTAIGASAITLVREVFKIGRWYVGVGLLLGFAASLAVGKALQLLVRMENHPLNLPQTLFCLLAVLVFSFFAMGFPAWRASKVDPMLALRTD